MSDIRHRTWHLQESLQSRAALWQRRPLRRDGPFQQVVGAEDALHGNRPARNLIGHGSVRPGSVDQQAPQ
eukprot:12429056-Alexandrium_andersonii.AAC.1